MQLPRLIENPDGMGLAPDGALIVLENAIQSGGGGSCGSFPKAAGMHRIEILREGMESPVNLTIPTRLRLCQRIAHPPPPAARP